MSRDHTIKITDDSPRRIGVVESDARDKTRKVVLAFVARHPKYGKFTKRRTVLHVHDEKNESHVGDRVEVGPYVLTLRDAPPAPEDVTTSRTCADSVDVNTFTSSGMMAPASVPQVITVESFHQSEESPPSRTSR